MKILICEDDKKIIEIINAVLHSNGHEIVCTYNGIEGYDAFTKHTFDLVITDIMMPQLDGYGFVKLIRDTNKEIPILMLTALGEEYDEIKGFDLGIDDYVTKPFSINVLVKRVEALLKRTAKIQNIQYGDLEINFESFNVKFKKEDIKLTLKEFEILKYLIENKNIVVTREKLLDAVWGVDYFGEIRIIDSHIKNLRKKVPVDNLKTITGIGYKFEI